MSKSSDHDQMLACNYSEEARHRGLSWIESIRNELESKRKENKPKKSRKRLKVHCQDFRYDKVYQAQARRANCPVRRNTE